MRFITNTSFFLRSQNGINKPPLDATTQGVPKRLGTKEFNNTVQATKAQKSRRKQRTTSYKIEFKQVKGLRRHS